MTKSRPILFNGAMVRAIRAPIERRKTQTRRVISLQTGDTFDEHALKGVIQEWRPVFDEVAGRNVAKEAVAVKCPYGLPGDRLWVRETFAITRSTLDYETGGEASEYAWDEEIYGDPREWLDGNARGGIKASVWYAADGEDNNPAELSACIGLNGKILRKAEINWTPSIFMPRWACRNVLEILDVRAERLQDISEEDALAEGIYFDKIGYTAGFIGKRGINQEWSATPKIAFANLWRAINGHESWNANPWVWVVEFKRIEVPA